MSLITDITNVKMLLSQGHPNKKIIHHADITTGTKHDAWVTDLRHGQRYTQYYSLFIDLPTQIK